MVTNNIKLAKLFRKTYRVVNETNMSGLDVLDYIVDSLVYDWRKDVRDSFYKQVYDDIEEI